MRWLCVYLDCTIRRWYWLLLATAGVLVRVIDCNRNKLHMYRLHTHRYIYIYMYRLYRCICFSCRTHCSFLLPNTANYNYHPVEWTRCSDSPPTVCLLGVIMNFPVNGVKVTAMSDQGPMPIAYRFRVMKASTSNSRWMYVVKVSETVDISSVMRGEFDLDTRALSSQTSTSVLCVSTYTP